MCNNNKQEKDIETALQIDTRDDDIALNSVSMLKQPEKESPEPEEDD